MWPSVAPSSAKPGFIGDTDAPHRLHSPRVQRTYLHGPVRTHVRIFAVLMSFRGGSLFCDSILPLMLWGSNIMRMVMTLPPGVTSICPPHPPILDLPPLRAFQLPITSLGRSSTIRMVDVAWPLLTWYSVTSSIKKRYYLRILSCHANSILLQRVSIDLVRIIFNASVFFQIFSLFLSWICWNIQTFNARSVWWRSTFVARRRVLWMLLFGPMQVCAEN